MLASSFCCSGCCGCYGWLLVLVLLLLLLLGGSGDGRDQVWELVWVKVKQVSRREAKARG